MYHRNMPVAATAKSIVDSFREMAQDLLVPELKAVRVSVDGLRTEMQLRDEKLADSVEAVRTKLSDSVEALRTEMRLRDERTQESIRHLDERTTALILHLDEKTQQSIRALDDRTQSSLERLAQRLDLAIDIRERLAALEARSPKQ
jgi:hypothetical protein